MTSGRVRKTPRTDRARRIDNGDTRPLLDEMEQMERELAAIQSKEALRLDELQAMQRAQADLNAEVTRLTQQARIAWERHAEKDRAYGEALKERDAIKALLAEVKVHHADGLELMKGAHAEIEKLQSEVTRLREENEELREECPNYENEVMAKMARALEEISRRHDNPDNDYSSVGAVALAQCSAALTTYVQWRRRPKLTDNEKTIVRLRSLLQQMLHVAENCYETGYVDGEGFVDVDKLHSEVKAALAAGWTH